MTWLQKFISCSFSICKDENGLISLVDSFEDSSLSTSYDCIRISIDFFSSFEYPQTERAHLFIQAE